MQQKQGGATYSAAAADRLVFSSAIARDATRVAHAVSTAALRQSTLPSAQPVFAAVGHSIRIMLYHMDMQTN